MPYLRHPILLFALSNRLALLLWTLLSMLAFSPAFAASLAERAEQLHLGDTEERVLQVMADKPVEATHSELAGVPRTVLVYESGNSVCTVHLAFGRLVGKKVEQKRSRLLPSLAERAAQLHLGDQEARVLQVMVDKPVEVTRSELAGVSRTVLVYESGNSVCTVHLAFGRLVGKKVEQKRSRLLPF